VSSFFPRFLPQPITNPEVLCLGLQFSEKKIFRGTRNRRKFGFIPSEFRLFRGTKNARNSVPNPSAEDKKVRNSVPNHLLKKQITRNFVISFQTIPRKIKWRGHTVRDRRPCTTACPGLVDDGDKHPSPSPSSLLLLCWPVPSNLFFRGIPSDLFRTSEWVIPRHTEFREISTFFRGITKTVPSLFRGICSERNFDGNPICAYAGEEVWLYNTPISEDCLYLSVTRPAHKSATPLPVMVGLLCFHQRGERLGERGKPGSCSAGVGWLVCGLQLSLGE
jgi:hypothetical protein